MVKQYRLIRAANILNCSTLELVKQPLDGPYGDWIKWAFVAEEVDQIVEREYSPDSDDDDDDDE